MRRVVVIGCMGTGKSVFAERLSRATDLKLYHLDRLFWKPGRGGTARQEWLSIREKISAGGPWIIEGNYGATIDVQTWVHSFSLPPGSCTYDILFINKD